MEYRAQLDQLRATAQLRSHLRQAQRDLDRMYANCCKTCDDLSRESVECRRLGRVTPKYTEIEARLQQEIKQYEQWILMARLRF